LIDVRLEMNPVVKGPKPVYFLSDPHAVYGTRRHADRRIQICEEVSCNREWMHKHNKNSGTMPRVFAMGVDLPEYLKNWHTDVHGNKWIDADTAPILAKYEMNERKYPLNKSEMYRMSIDPNV